MELTEMQRTLERLGYEAAVFPDGEAAVQYLRERVQGRTVAIGGSVTAAQLGLREALEPACPVIWHMQPAAGEDPGELRQRARSAQVYISSVNALARTGEMVNIDNTGNRVAGTLFGPETVYLIIGENKITEDLESALWRARNVAAPKNAQRLRRDTPCALRGDRCYNCSSPDRICRVLTVFWQKPAGCRYEVLLIRQQLGY